MDLNTRVKVNTGDRTHMRVITSDKKGTKRGSVEQDMTRVKLEITN